MMKFVTQKRAEEVPCQSDGLIRARLTVKIRAYIYLRGRSVAQSDRHSVFTRRYATGVVSVSLIFSKYSSESAEVFTEEKCGEYITDMSGNQDYKNATSVYDFTVKSIKGEDVPLSKYKGHVLLIVNVASKCGLTATNYKELNELHDQFAETKGLRILAFPCNQFGGQEPGSSDDICSFAARQKVKFELFEKIDVNGDNAHPLWKYLKQEQGGLLISAIKWNFTKFIVDKEGKVVERHGPKDEPSKLVSFLEKYF